MFANPVYLQHLEQGGRASVRITVRFTLEQAVEALELAAGRLGVLSPADVEQRLGEGILRSAEEGRHGTLEGALQLSWELLDPSEKRALIDLTVFVGGFDSGAAEAVGVGYWRTNDQVIDANTINVAGCAYGVSR